MPKKKPEKEPKAAKAKKTKEKPPKKKKGKGKDAADAAVEATEATTAENGETAEEGGEKPKKKSRGILEPLLCVLIAAAAVFEIGAVYLWLTTPSTAELRAQREAQAARETWSTASYSNRHGSYRPSDAPAPVAVFATSDDIPATARPAAQEPAAQPETNPTPTV